MKWLALACALLAGLAAFGWRRSDAHATALRLSLEAAHTQYAEDSTAWVARDRARLATMVALREDSAWLARAYRQSRQAANEATVTLRNLLAQTPDSAGAHGALETILDAGERCEAARLNAEARATTCGLRLSDALARVRAADSLRETTWAAWHDAERRAAPNLFRDFWRARAITLPLAGAVAILLLLK